MKQVTIFNDDNGDSEKKYSAKIESPIYEPRGKKPHVIELIDNGKCNRLIQEIKNSSVSEEDKNFLIEAAKRHNVFNYEKIADYYAHSSKDVQLLMEKSALVIIDFEKAIELGYVRLSESIKSEFLTSNGE